MRERKSINVQIGRNLQQAREQAGLTQDKLSEIIGVTPNHISAIERGIYGVSIESLIRICTALRVSTDSVLMGTARDLEIMALLERIRSVDEDRRALVLRGIEVLLSLSETD